MAGEEIPIVARIQARSDGFERQLAAANKKLSRFQSSSGKITSAIQSQFVGMFAGYAVINGLKTAVSKIADFEQQLDKVQAVSGATESEMKRLKDQALELGRTSKFTATEIGQLEENLARLGFDTSKILASTEAISKLAIVADADLGESAKTLAGTLNSFNLEATESERVANVMAESFSKSALDIEKFTVATANSGAIARVMGVTLEQNTARLGKLVDANIDASKAGTDLRKIYLDLNQHGLTYDEAMQQIANSSDKAGTAQRLFGDRAAGAAVILSGMQTEVNDLTDKLSDSNQELDKMVGIMEDNLLTDWIKFQSAIDGTIQKGGVLNESIRDLIQGLTDNVSILNNEAIPAWKKYANWLSLGIFRKSILEQGELALAVKKTAESLDLAKSKAEAKVLAFKVYRKAIDEGVTSLDEMLKRIQFLNDEDEANVRVELEKRHKAAIDAKLESLKKEVELMNSLKKEAKELESIRQAQSNLSKIKTNGLDIMTMGDFNLSGGMDAQIAALMAEGSMANSALNAEFEKALEESSAIGEDYMNRLRQQTESLNAIVNDTIANAIGGFIDAAAGGGIEQAFASLLGIIGDGLQGLGKTLIAYGLALDAFKKAITNPFVAIAAGAAAIAIGSVFKKQAAGIASSVSSGSGGGGYSGGSPSGSFVGSASGSQSVILDGKFTIEGNDLVYLYNQNQLLNGRAVG